MTRSVLEVFHAERHASKRPGILPGRHHLVEASGLLERALTVDRDKRVYRWVERLDALEGV